LRHKFHDVLAAVKKNPKHKLPDDINAPIHEYLKKINCPIGEKALLDAERDCAYEGIDLIHENVPNAKLSMHIDCGMVGEMVKWEVLKDGPWTLIKYRSVKNSNLDKSKPKKEGYNGKP
jgi:hypothetical protein